MEGYYNLNNYYHYCLGKVLHKIVTQLISCGCHKALMLSEADVIHRYLIMLCDSSVLYIFNIVSVHVFDMRVFKCDTHCSTTCEVQSLFGILVIHGAFPILK